MSVQFSESLLRLPPDCLPLDGNINDIAAQYAGLPLPSQRRAHPILSFNNLSLPDRATAQRAGSATAMGVLSASVVLSTMSLYPTEAAAESTSVSDSRSVATAPLQVTRPETAAITDPHAPVEPVILAASVGDSEGGNAFVGKLIDGVSELIGIPQLGKRKPVDSIQDVISDPNAPPPADITVPSPLAFANLSVNDFTKPSTGVVLHNDYVDLPSIPEFLGTNLDRVVAVLKGDGEYITPEMRKYTRVNPTEVYRAADPNAPADEPAQPVEHKPAKTPALKGDVEPAFESKDFKSDVISPIIGDPGKFELTLNDNNKNAVFKADPGSQVLALTDSTALFVKEFKNKPGKVLLEDNSDHTRWLYEGLDKNINIKEGETIEPGKVFGELGTGANGKSELKITHLPQYLYGVELMTPPVVSKDALDSLPVINDSDRLGDSWMAMGQLFSEVHGTTEGTEPKDLSGDKEPADENVPEEKSEKDENSSGGILKLWGRTGGLLSGGDDVKVTDLLEVPPLDAPNADPEPIDPNAPQNPGPSFKGFLQTSIDDFTKKATGETVDPGADDNQPEDPNAPKDKTEQDPPKTNDAPKAEKKFSIPSKAPENNDNHARELYTVQYLIDHGNNWTDVMGAAVAGNWKIETYGDLDPKTRQGRHTPEYLEANKLGEGAGQWSHGEGNRWNNLLAFAKEHNKDPYDYDTQLDFMLHEIENVSPWNKALKAMRDAETVEEATIAFEQYYELAGNPAHGRRTKAGASILKMFRNAK